MGIFDVFTGGPVKDAAALQRGIYDRTQDQGRTDLSSGYGRAADYIQGGTTAAIGNLGMGYSTATGAVNQGYTDASGALNSGAGAARGQYDAARGAYDSLSALGSKYGAGTSLYLDSLGVNGADGNTRASSAFQPSGAYGFNLDQGLESINRAQNARGQAFSGNTDRSAQEYGAGLASKEYGGWQDRLAGLINPELSATAGAATGRAGVNLAQAGYEGNLGQIQAQLDSGRGSMLAGLASTYGTGTANLNSGQGTSLANLATGEAGARLNLANNVMQPYAQTYKTAADAEMAGNANAWKLGMEGAKLIATGGLSGLGGMGGGMGGFGASAANSGAAGGGYYGAGGQLEPGPGYYSR